MSNSDEDDELTLRELFEALGRAKWPILIVTLLTTLGGYVTALLIPKQYEAQIVVAPADTDSNGGVIGGISGMASQLGGLASLAGFGGAGDSKKWEGVAVLQSQSLTVNYIERENLLPIIYAKRWDPVKRAWKVSDPAKIPTPWKATAYFKANIRTLSTDSKTGLSTMKITWKDPQQAAKWANGLVALTNEVLRDKAIAESDRHIAFLNEQAAKTETLGEKQAIYAIMESEVNKEMMAKGNFDYALKVIDPALVPERPVFPDPGILTAAGAFAGLALSVVVVLARLSWNKR